MRSHYHLLFAIVLVGASACGSSERVAGDRIQVADEAVTASEPAGAATDAAGEPLPLDPKVRLGRLDNGLTYYVRHNEKPTARAELRLVVNAGSVLEKDAQRGLAHFAEHMAFNGTERFKKQELVDYLELTGSRFGADVNAYTSFDETVYMLKVRSDSLDRLDTGIEILREWAGRVAFEPEEIEKERGVVIEEWRLGRGAQMRIANKQLPVLLKGSRYAERLPIGVKEVLESFDSKELTDFYHDWYRPDLMAVIAVGDFDADRVENEIRELFSDLVPPQSVRAREEFSVPGNKEPLVALATDPEATFGSVSVVFKIPEQDINSIEGYRRGLVESLYHSMFNARLQELTQNTDPPFAFAGSGRGSFARNPDFYNLGAIIREGEMVRALEVLLEEAERVRRFGFTSTELDRAKIDLLRSMEQAYNERDKTESASYVGEYVRHFLVDEPSPGIEFEYGVTREVVPEITLAEVNDLATSFVTRDNRVVLADGPEKPGVVYPTEEELLKVFDETSGRELAAYEDRVRDEPLLEQAPSPGRIVSEEDYPEVGVTRLHLSNGAQVILKPTDFKNDEVLLSAVSPGGTSLVDDAHYEPARFASTLIGQSGVGNFDPVELEKKLAGEVVSMSPYIADLTEGFRGGAAPQDLETMFKLLYLYVTQPRADSVAYESYRQRIGSLLLSSKADPLRAFQDTVAVTMAQHHPREMPFSEKTLERMDLQESLKIFRDRFADTDDFTYFIVGAFKPDVIRPLIETYLATLPSTDRRETWRDVGVRPPKGQIERTVYRGLEPRSQVYIAFTGDAKWTNRERRVLGALDNVLSIRLREVLREDLGGTYGVRVNSQLQRYPYEAYQIAISFGCDPERVEELTDRVYSVIDSLKTDGTTPENLQKTRETWLAAHQVGLEQNNSWLSWLQYYEQNDLNFSEIPTALGDFVDSLTLGEIQEAAKLYLDDTNRVRVVLYPEDRAPSRTSESR